MPNGQDAECLDGRNAERAECRTPAGRMPKRSTSRNQTKISVVVTVWHICVQELGMTERYKSDVDYYCRHCCDISSYGCANLIEILTEHM